MLATEGPVHPNHMETGGGEGNGGKIHMLVGLLCRRLLLCAEECMEEEQACSVLLRGA